MPTQRANSLLSSLKNCQTNSAFLFKSEMASIVAASKKLVSRTSGVSVKSFATISFGKNGELTSASSAPSTAAINAGSVKVSIKASAVTVEDVRTVRGLSLNAHSSGVAGSTGTGIVTGVAAGESAFAVNDQVLIVGEGVWTDETVVSTGNVTKIPKLSSEEAAVLPTFAAAWAILNNFATLKAGDVVVQTSANGAIGSAIAQVGKALGLKVVSISDADLAAADLASKLKEAGSIKLAVSGRSGRHISTLQRVVAKGGVTVSYNGVFESLQTIGSVQLPISNLIFSDTSVHGFDLNAWAATSPEAFRASVASVLGLVGDKKVTLKPAHVFSQAEYAKALEEVSKSGASVALKH